MKRIWRWSRLPLAIYAIILVAMFTFERQLVFPAPRANRSEVDAAPFGGEDVFFESTDGTQLHGWYFPSDSPRGHLIYCHGNGDMVPNLGDFAALIRDLAGYSVFLFDYRGYGISEGSPAADGILCDARAARDWFVEKEQIEPTDIVWMGRSLGGAVSVAMAAESGAKGLVLQSTFASLKETAAMHFRWLPVRLMMRTEFRSAANIGKYHGPLLQSHGTADQVIPFSQGRKLFEAANEPKAFFEVPGGGHNQNEPPEYYAQLQQFLAALVR